MTWLVVLLVVLVIAGIVFGIYEYTQAQAAQQNPFNQALSFLGGSGGQGLIAGIEGAFSSQGSS